MTTHYGTSHRNLPVITPAPLPSIVEPLPVEGSPTPRRRRTFTCPHLRIGGEPVTAFRPRNTLTNGQDITTGYCTVRRVGIAGSLIIDLCGCSWARTCPFLPVQVTVAKPQADTGRTVANPVSAPVVAPRIEKRRCTRCGEDKPTAQFTQYAKTKFGNTCATCVAAQNDALHQRQAQVIELRNSGMPRQTIADTLGLTFSQVKHALRTRAA